MHRNKSIYVFSLPTLLLALDPYFYFVLCRGLFDDNFGIKLRYVVFSF